MTEATVIAATGGAIRCAVWLDSGADSCAFPISFAALLGLDVLKLPMALTAGVGSSLNNTYYAWLDIDLGRGIRFRSFAGFTDGLEKHGIGLLGQEGFFEFYNVRLSHKERKFTIETT